jgi:hypothetical protein
MFWVGAFCAPTFDCWTATDEPDDGAGAGVVAGAVVGATGAGVTATGAGVAATGA